MFENLIAQGCRVLENAQLKDYTTFQLGAGCRVLIDCKTPDQLVAAVKTLNEEKINFILIGGGSNLVISDIDLDCAVIRYVSDEPIIELDGTSLKVAACTSLDALVEFALRNSLDGINTCSGIPGTVGGAVVGNAGAFGKQIGDVVKYITVLSSDGKQYRLQKNELEFSYRDSILKQRDDIVVEVVLELVAGDKIDLKDERMSILTQRSKKHPNLQKDPCAGSFFRNVEPTSKADRRQAAGWFLEQAGGKLLTSGGAQIFSKHANIIIKGENCSAEDVYNLHEKMAALVKEAHSIDLTREVRFVGSFNKKPEYIQQIIW